MRMSNKKLKRRNIMKKLATILAAILVCTSLFACDSGDSASTTAEKTDAPSQTTVLTTTIKTPESTTEPTTPPSTPATTGGDDDLVTPLADSTKFKVDGDLSEWKDVKKLSVIGEGSTEPKKVDFYAIATDKGIFLACEAYHDSYITEGELWWQNTNFEFFFKSVNSGDTSQWWVSAKGYPLDGSGELTLGTPEGCQIDEAVMLTKENEGGTAYHSTVEAFISFESMPADLFDFEWNCMYCGMGWKTPGDLIIGGSCNANPDGSDEYWTYAWPANSSLLIDGTGLIDENMI